MYQLSHTLTEQRALLNSLMETSLLGDKVPALDLDFREKEKEEKEDEGRKKLTEVLEKVEGCVVRRFKIEFELKPQLEVNVCPSLLSTFPSFLSLSHRVHYFYYRGKEYIGQTRA